ncbi:RNA polymerase sigma-54 factor [Thalassobaculum fulvum]|uniref:RNA polymerase sigma-54 factor n=1 Tax=Thalassobaculum fulvum TaxID=1633335 RepID=A0A918XXK4_9PROT|nr:RNA polymerase factor sigma-54 [Thalassobaculum fulvum]GHD64018.1 RNA polymerase sigma-54 factor [Thalassobaculum fulvum]
MALSQRLDLRHSQSLVLTPQLQQAIKLLQLNNLELTEYVEGELAQNPLLERDDGEGPATLEAVERDNLLRHESEEPAERVRDTAERAANETLPNAAEDPSDVDYDNNWGSAGIEESDGVAAMGAGAGELAGWRSTGGHGGDGDEFGLEHTLSETKTLRDHLLDQMAIEIADPADRLIAAHLIDMVDAAGYLSGPVEPLAEQLGCSPDDVERVLERLQRLDPAGVFARDLKECLALQLRDRNRYDPCMEALLANLPMLAQRDFAGLRRVCGVDDEDLGEMIAEIKSLNPKPGEAFEPPLDQPVVPDVIVRRGPDGGWAIELNTDTLPRVLVNNAYFSEVSGRTAKDKKAKEYLSDCLQSANWLVRSLHQRATTILKVATEIVRQQGGFLEHGVQHLRPLVLRDIADAIGMHESTVSRVTSNKFVATPRGIFELKYFFTAAIASAGGGEAHSAEAVRDRIKRLIDAEPPSAVLSDDRIVELLRADGVDIARRTVAKYREALRIPSSVQRRREKAMLVALPARG